MRENLLYFALFSWGPSQNFVSNIAGRKGVLRNFTKFTGKHLCQGLFFNKIIRQKKIHLLKWNKTRSLKWIKSYKNWFVKITPLPYSTKRELKKLRLIFDILVKCCRSFQTASAGKRKLYHLSYLDAWFSWLDSKFHFHELLVKVSPTRFWTNVNQLFFQKSCEILRLLGFIF